MFCEIPRPSGVYKNLIKACEILRDHTTFGGQSYAIPETWLCADVYSELKWTRWILESWVEVMNQFGTSDEGLQIETVHFGSVRVRVYKPLLDDTSLPAVVFLHGGGYVLANIDTYESMARRIAITVVAVVVSVDYRLAPEHAFPAALDDAESVVVHLLTEAYAAYGVDPSRVAIMGDSAGGGIAAAVTHRLRKRVDLPKLRAQVLVYPELQMGNLRTPSYEYYRRVLNGRAFVDPRAVILYYLMYAGIDLAQHPHLISVALQNRHISSVQRAMVDKFVDIDRLPPAFRMDHNVSMGHYDEEAVRLLSPFVMNPEFCPLMEPNLRSLPPALVVTCQYDVLRDEGMLYARRLLEAGVPTMWKHIPNGFHALLNFHPIMTSSSRAFDEALTMKEGDESVINLLSRDGHVVNVPKCVAMVSQTIAQLFEGVPHDGHSPIPLYEVDYNSLKKIVAWMIQHAQSIASNVEPRNTELRHDGKADCIRDWERAQFECEERNDLFRLMNAANYLDIPPLTKATAAFVAEKLQTMTVDEARDYLNLVDDFTPEERDRIRNETMWAEPMASNGATRSGKCCV